MRISIFGLGYVGAVSLTCLARDGHDVTGVDLDPTKLELIRQGKTPIIETGMAELMQAVCTSGRVQVTSTAQHAIESSELSFVCVGTPSQRNGGQDLNAIRRVSEQIGAALRNKSDFHVVVIRSTVSPGTVESLVQPILEETSGKKAGEGFGLCFQPEFLREGSSIHDYDHPPMTVVGGHCQRSLETLRSLFAHLPCEFITTTIRTAEMLKYACNAFHAVKITFANEIGRISQSLDVDSRAVMELVCRDTRLNISPAYMKPGFAFGGSCLPKDLREMMQLARRGYVRVPMLESVIPSNELHIAHASDYVLSTGQRKIGMIGLSFKSGTDDLRESPLVGIAETFVGKGLDLTIFDPEVNVARLSGANKRFIEESLPHLSRLMCDSVPAALQQASMVVVGINDRPVLASLMEHLTPAHHVLDLVGATQLAPRAGSYQGICW